MKSQNTLEEWRPIDGFPNYQVSNLGRVKNIKRGYILKNNIGTYGYYRVNLGRGNMRKVHRLVAEAFIPNPLELPYINHLDENKLNNDVSNLEWATASQNNKHSAHQHSCKINQLTLDGDFIKTFKSAKEIQDTFGFDKSNVIAVCRGRINQTHGYKWEYAEPSQQHNMNRKVVCSTINGEYVRTFKNPSEAAKMLGIKPTCIKNCLYFRIKQTHGYKFHYLI